jgi:cardiolipin synthase C
VSRVVSLLCIVTAAGCASLPAPVVRQPEHAIGDPQSTAWGKKVQAAEPEPGVSGFRLLEAGADAFAALGTLIDRAQRSLDLQYYLVRDEVSSRNLLQRVYIAAAQRHVRARLLIDDFNTAGEEDLLLCLARVPGIEVRLYNPFPAGRFSTLSRVIASATDVSRISARMHNKMLVADNALAVTGGRNLGDAYFVQSRDANFLDLDLLVAGPVVRRLSASFDRFWNSALAYPIDTIVTRKASCQGADPVRPQAPAGPAIAEATRAEPAPLAHTLLQGQLPLQWVPATLLADSPSKITSDGHPLKSETISDNIEQLLKAARQEVIIISPYFVPGERGLQLVEALRRRGVRVRVLTNSLAATDAPAVHIGYARYRARLLAMGAELYELRPRLGQPHSGVGNFGSSHASLHAKALVIDRSVVLLGSMNMDPRSANLNSEIGLVLRSPALAAQLVRLYDDVTERSSYHVQLWDGYHLRWNALEDDATKVYETEPDADLGLRLLLWAIAPFAPEQML